MKNATHPSQDVDNAQTNTTDQIDQMEAIIANQSQELKKLREQLEQANGELEQFALVANHDLQEPIRKIRAFAGILSECLPTLSEKEKSYLEKIISASDRLSVLISSILNFSNHVKVKEKIVTTDLNEIIKNAIAELHEQIETANATINISTLPTIKVLPEQIHILFSNLISNSLKFTKKNQPAKIYISVNTPTQETLVAQKLPTTNTSYYELIFSDEGIGFDPKLTDQAFHIFQRLHDRSYSGTGIGLALCRKIVQNHGGEIYAQTQEGMGTKVYVILPSH